MTRIDDVRACADPVVATHGFEIYDIEEHGPALRVTVTGSNGGPAAGIDDLTAITRELSRALDAADRISGSYTLEVSSPGLERRLRTPEHFRGAIGETASIKVRVRGESTRRVRGVILAADEQGVRVRPEPEPNPAAHKAAPAGGHKQDDSAEPEDLSYDTIDTARTVFEWGMTPPDRQPAESEPTGTTRRPEV